MLEMTMTYSLPRIAEKRTKNAFSRIYEKAMNFTACVLIIVEIGLTIAYSALSVASIEYLIPLAVLVADLAVISYILENFFTIPKGE